MHQAPTRSPASLQRGSFLGEVLAALALGVVAACGGGGGGGGAFEVVAVDVQEGASGWQLNRPIGVTFDRPVDPASVTTGTINVREPTGAPAFGTVSIDPADPRRVVWRPDCPLLDDLSDAGLKPDTGYVLSVVGSGPSAAFTVRGADGSVLERSLVRNFRTPDSAQFSSLFVDDGVGPPRAVVRDAGSATTAATHVLVGGTPHWFERQPGGAIALSPPLALPLNLLSDPATRVELFVQLDQSIDMRSTNVTPERVSWQYERAQGDWRPLAVGVTLEANCTDTGAVLRLVPEGLLPPACDLRVVLSAELRDLGGDHGQLAQTGFAPLRTAGPPGSGPLTDHALEDFATAAGLDAGAPFAEPQADWGGGLLAARSSFEGQGGAGGNFDWKVSSGEILLLSTVNDSILGGPGFVASKSQPVVAGVVDVRDLWIEDGGVVRFTGPNPVRILASGSVRIDGLLDLGGTSSPGVSSLNTTSTPEPGAAGQCGGGRGGTGSPLINTSSPRGGSGAGAFGALGGGGEGGETGWAHGPSPDARRGGGGGGGRFGENVPDPTGAGSYDQRRIGLDGEDGFDNDEAQNGALGGPGPARGGRLGPSPFVDADPGNDFHGAMLDTVAGRLVTGELKLPWAGAGGGAGGDAARLPSGQSFPAQSFDPTGDEKGAGGGGGGGSLSVLAIGDIVFGPSGRITCRGGSGGGGENPSSGGLGRIGGGSGGGSGGHVILQTAGVIDLSAVSGGQVAILATGGQGGAGKNDLGGAFRSNTGVKETAPTNDACPAGESGCLAPAPGGALPAPGAGGDGGPGLVQLHTTGGVLGVDVLLAPGETLHTVSRPPPYCPLGAAGGCRLVPSFGRTSRARSDWIALGEGGFDAASGGQRDVRFRFGGIQPVDTPTLRAGEVLREPSSSAPGTMVLGLPPLLVEQGVTPAGRSLAFDAAPLAGGPDAVVLEQPALLVHCLVELVDSSAPTHFQRFDVVAARHDPATGLLTVDLDPNGPALESFVAAGPVDAELQPASFRVVTDGVPDALPTEVSVSIFLDATTADAAGAPDLSYGPGGDEPWLRGVTDVDDPVRGLNFAGNAGLRFVRFEVLFDRAAPPAKLAPSSPVPALDFLRLRFEYP